MIHFIANVKLTRNYSRHHHPYQKEYLLPNVSFAVQSSGFKTEGAWNASGKGPNVGDTWAHTHPELIADGSNADVSADSYHNYKIDIDIIKQLNVSYYCLILNWARIMPDGSLYTFNQDGIDYYNNVIDYATSQDIVVHIIMTQFDLPQAIADIGG